MTLSKRNMENIINGQHRLTGSVKLNVSSPSEFPSGSFAVIVMMLLGTLSPSETIIITEPAKQ